MCNGTNTRGAVELSRPDSSYYGSGVSIIVIVFSSRHNDDIAKSYILAG